MTDIEDQLRAYSAAITASQRPVELHEAMARAAARRGRRLIGVAVAVVVVLVAGAVGVVLRADRVETGRPNTSGHRPAVGLCPAASLVVSSTSGERLHPNWLPSGFVLTAGTEADLGQTGGLMYSTPRHGDRPYVEISRERSSLPLTRLYAGTPTPTVVQGHPGILSVGNPIPLWTALLWRPESGVVLVVNGYKLTRPDLYKIATNLQYEPGSPFQYPSHVRLTVSREEALADLAGPSNEKHIALTSVGEFDTLARSDPQPPGLLPALVAGSKVTRPIWIAWTQNAANTSTRQVHYIDAQTGQQMTINGVSQRTLDSITDRSQPTCAPPFGTLTRTEAIALQPPPPPAQRTVEITKLSTQGTIDTHRHINPIACDLPRTCDPTVPIWIFIQTAADQRFTQMEMGGPARQTHTQPGSYSITMLDARTGPQNTNFGRELGPGPAPTSILAVPDLASAMATPSKGTEVASAPPLPKDIASLICANFASEKPTSIEYVTTTERRETQVLNTEDGNTNTPVWVIEMRESFSAPRGRGFRGTVATVTYDAATHASIGLGIVNQYRDLHVLGPVGTLTC